MTTPPITEKEKIISALRYLAECIEGGSWNGVRAELENLLIEKPAEKCEEPLNTPWKDIINKHTPTTSSDWREEFNKLMTYESVPGAEIEPYPKFPVYPGYEALKSFIEKTLSSTREATRREMLEKLHELVQKYHDTKYHNDAEKALSDVLTTLRAVQEGISSEE